jgi:heme/copper-type cytochrome/quinol oxidase subunit 2
MNTSALALMLVTMLLVTGMTCYFFFKVLVTPEKPEPENYREDDKSL